MSALFHNDCGGGYCEACAFEERYGEDAEKGHRDCGGGSCMACREEERQAAKQRERDFMNGVEDTGSSSEDAE